MSMTNTAPIAAAALLVLEKEALWTDALVLRSNTAAAKKVDLDAAQADYEAQVLLRTTPTGAISPATVTEHIVPRDTIVVAP